MFSFVVINIDLIFFFVRSHLNVKWFILRFLFLETYLNSNIFNLLFTKIKFKLNVWKTSLFSLTQRVELGKGVAHLPFFLIYYWLITFLNNIDKWIRNFIWAGDINNRKVINNISLYKVCIPILWGGLIITFLRDINETTIIKLGVRAP